MSCRALASHTVLPGSHQITTRWAERWRLANRQLTAQKPRFVCANWHFKADVHCRSLLTQVLGSDSSRAS